MVVNDSGSDERHQEQKKRRATSIEDMLSFDSTKLYSFISGLKMLPDNWDPSSVSLTDREKELMDGTTINKVLWRALCDKEALLLQDIYYISGLVKDAGISQYEPRELLKNLREHDGKLLAIHPFKFYRDNAPATIVFMRRRRKNGYLTDDVAYLADKCIHKGRLIPPNDTPLYSDVRELTHYMMSRKYGNDPHESTRPVTITDVESAMAYTIHAIIRGEVGVFDEDLVERRKDLIVDVPLHGLVAPLMYQVAEQVWKDYVPTEAPKKYDVVGPAIVRLDKGGGQTLKKRVELQKHK